MLAVLCGPLVGVAQADHPDTTAKLTPSVKRVLGPAAEPTRGGLFKVPLPDGSVVRTHGPDPTEAFGSLAGPGGRFGPGNPERAPICATDHSMQVLYARKSTSPNNLAASTPQIRSIVGRTNQILHEEAIASGGTSGDYKAVCTGDGQVDVGSFTTSGLTFNDVVNAARNSGFNNDGARNYAIFLDEFAPGGYCGVGSIYPYDMPGLANPSNQNGGYSVIYKGCWEGTTFMHEVGHNRGAVQEDSPNSTGSGGHCNEGYDVMCYSPDGGDRNQNGMLYPCQTATLFDCNYDDYFDAAPEPGEYLASHWNLGTEGQNFMVINADEEPPPGDTAAPETTITSGPASKTTKGRAVFAFEGADDVTAGSSLVFECSYNRTADAPCSSPHSLKLMPGSHRFKVTATDAAGNADATPATWSWKIVKKKRRG